MMILSCILDLKTTQADITAAFVHAHLNQKDEVYINQPRGFWAPGTTNRSHVLKLKRALYGLKQSPRCFFQHLSKHLVMRGLKQSSFDPCLFIGHDVIVIVYVDGILLTPRQMNQLMPLSPSFNPTSRYVKKTQLLDSWVLISSLLWWLSYPHAIRSN
jgi:hypothetical protein